MVARGVETELRPAGPARAAALAEDVARATEAALAGDGTAPLSLLPAVEDQWQRARRYSEALNGLAVGELARLHDVLVGDQERIVRDAYEPVAEDDGAKPDRSKAALLRLAWALGLHVGPSLVVPPDVAALDAPAPPRPVAAALDEAAERVRAFFAEGVPA